MGSPLGWKVLSKGWLGNDRGVVFPLLAYRDMPSAVELYKILQELSLAQSIMRAYIHHCFNVPIP